MTRTVATRALCAAAGLALAASGANAAMITFIYTGFASGTLAGSFFGAAAPVPFTITATADNTNALSTGFGWRLTHDTATIDIGGIGALNISTITSSAVNFNSDSMFFANLPANLSIYFLGANAALDGWDMLSSIGPFDLDSTAQSWDEAPLQTSGGELEFTSASGTGTFQAIVVPAPASLGAFALAGLVATRRRR